MRQTRFELFNLGRAAISPTLDLCVSYDISGSINWALVVYSEFRTMCFLTDCKWRCLRKKENIHLKWEKRVNQEARVFEAIIAI